MFLMILERYCLSEFLIFLKWNLVFGKGIDFLKVKIDILLLLVLIFFLGSRGYSGVRMILFLDFSRYL